MHRPHLAWRDSCACAAASRDPVGCRASFPMSALTAYVDKQVLVITQDGRVIVGELKGFDQTTNVILSGSVERVFSADEPVEEVPLGVYIVRGDNITLIGEVDTELDKQVDLATVRAEPISELQH
ncbi:hypothetical protein JCM3775_004488 [Rhodotorula graminis]